MCALPSAAQQIDPMTKAMLDGYEELLRENPKDYETLYERAAQYFRMSRYDEALNDLGKAIQCTPANQPEMAARELSLLADVNIELKRYDKALEAVDKVLEITPESYADLYKRGNVCLYLNRPEEARSSFSAMQRLKARSQEAFFGMAKADIMLGKRADAKALMKQAEEADPSNYVTFCRLGDLHQDLGEDEEAVASYLSAFSLASDPTRPLQSMVALAHRNYPAFQSAIDYALTQTDNKTPLYFLKGNIALNSGNYAAAREALSSLLALPEGREGDVYAQMARACYALDLLGEAQTNIDLGLVKSQTAANYVTKSEIELALGNPAAALLAAKKGVTADPQSVDALVAQALAQVALDQGKEALTTLNEAVMTDPGNTYPLMLRAWVNSSVLKDEKAAVADWTRVASAEAEGLPALAWKALAQSRTGKKLDADATIEKALGENPDKNDWFYAAVYHAQSGNLEKGMEMLVKARDAGFQNKRLLDSDRTADLSVAPLRH